MEPRANGSNWIFLSLSVLFPIDFIERFSDLMKTAVVGECLVNI